MPAMKQLLFLPVEQTINIVKTVQRFQDMQNELTTDQLAKYFHKLKSKSAEVFDTRRLMYKKLQRLKAEYAKMRECHTRVMHYKK